MLWKIEESFRLFKSHLETRPVYHRNPKRIKGHLVLCFLALLLERHLEILLKKEAIDYSAEKIREAIKSLQASRIEIDGKSFYLRSQISPMAEHILKSMDIKAPLEITKEECFPFIN